MPELPAYLREELQHLLAEPVPPHKDARIETMRHTHRRAYCAWSPAEDDLLLALARAGWGSADLARLLQRQSGALSSRLKKLAEQGLLPPDADPRPERVAQVSVLQLQRELGTWLEAARQGNVIEIVDGSHPVARLLPPR